MNVYYRRIFAIQKNRKGNKIEVLLIMDEIK